MIRHKTPDKKNALSIIEAAKKDLAFTISLPVKEEAGSTIIRNIYESFRMLGEAILIIKGIESKDHILPLKTLLNLEVKTSRPIQLISNLRTIRHNINYNGYSPNLTEVKDSISIAKSCFYPLYEKVKKICRDF